MDDKNNDKKSGIEVYKNGDKFIGNKKISKIYQGSHLNDKRNGQGTYIYKNEDRYEGNWKDDMKVFI